MPPPPKITWLISLPATKATIAKIQNLVKKADFFIVFLLNKLPLWLSNLHMTHYDGRASTQRDPSVNRTGNGEQGDR
jgi:hypothetical protein